MELSSIKNRKVIISLELNYIISCIYVIFMLTPYLYRNINRIILIALLVLLFLSQLKIVFLKKKDSQYIVNTTLLIYIWIFYQCFLRIIGYSTSAFGNYMTLIFFFEGMIQMLYIYIYYDKVHKRRLVMFILFILLINIIDNIRLGILYPNSNSYIYQEWGKSYLLTNIGGTEFDASAMFLCCTFFSLYLSRLHKLYLRNKLCLLFFTCVILYYLFVISSRATSIIVMLAFICYLPFKDKKGICISIIVIVCLMIMFLKLDVTSLIGNTRLTERLIDIQNLFSGNSINNSGSFGTRISLDLESFHTFISSPKNFFLGMGNYDSLSSVKIGHHSEMLDLLAKYGLIGLFFMSCIYFRIYRIICLITQENLTNGNIVFIFFVLYSFLNVAFDPMIGIIVFIASPYISSIIKNDVDIDTRMTHKSIAVRN